MSPQTIDASATTKDRAIVPDTRVVYLPSEAHGTTYTVPIPAPQKS